MTEVTAKKPRKTLGLKGKNPTVEEFAIQLGMTTEKLKQQLKEAVKDESLNEIKDDDKITAEWKQKLLAYLQGQRSEKSKITLKRREVKATKVVSGGKETTVLVERRQKRTFVAKASETDDQQTSVDAKVQKKTSKTPEAEVQAPPADAQPAVVDKSAAKKPVKKKTKEAPEKVERKSKKRGQSKPSFDDEMSFSRGGSKRKKDKAPQHAFEKPTAPVIHEVKVPDMVTVGDLAQRMALKAAVVVKTLMGMGVMATINQQLDQDTAVLVVEELGHKAIVLNENELEESLTASFADRDAQDEPRAPVVTIMGHVDHGKTSLLDYIRRSKVAQKEAGGITQHIGAYSVKLDKGLITFLDTPGHAAFSAMRARGANCTDIVILVVAADDGVMPQTLEAIQHIKASKAPVIVAINKMDKEKADPERIKSELGAHELIPEDWGGDTQFVPVSAKTGEGVDQLLDAILLQAEMLELKAVKDGAARGVIVESKIDKGRGAVVTALVQEGTLKKGDIILAGQEYGRVRSLLNENHQQLAEVHPSMAVEILGLSGAPMAGDELVVVPNEKRAKEIAEHRAHKFRQQKIARQQALKREGLFASMAQGDKQKVMTVMIKADVQGALEAIQDALIKLTNDEVKVELVAGGIGAINESDVHLAVSSKAQIVGFNVRADAKAKTLAQEEGVEIYYYSVIYELIDNVKNVLSGLLAPEVQEKIMGTAEVRDVFRSSKWGAIAGCRVIEGNIKRHLPIRVLRDNVVIYEGELESLKRFKEDVNEVRLDMECGIGVKDYNDVKVGDQIEVYEKVLVKRTL